MPEKVLSLCMIVRDDAKDLDRCLKSCSTLFDEIIIVDTGSQDNSKEVAEKYGAKIFDFVWVDDFAKARNFAFQQATCPWIMWLDADDLIKKDDLDKLFDLKERLLHSNKNAIMLIYHYNLHVKGYNYRIVRNDPGIRWKYPIHETLIFDKCVSEKFEAAVHHLGASGMARNIAILKKAYAGEWKDDGRIQHYLAREYCYTGEHEKAVEMYSKHLRNIPAYTRCGAYYYYAASCFKTGRYLKALDLCDYANKKHPIFADFYCLMGSHYRSQRDWSKSRECFTKALSHSYPTTTHEVFMLQKNYGSIPKENLKLLEYCIYAEN